MIREIRTAAVFDYPELLEAYAAECSIPLIGQINPQPKTYELMEQAGILKCFGFFEGHSLVGFVTVLTTVLPHYGKKVATVESIYAKRGGKDLMDAVENYAKESGCVAILYSAPSGGRLERLLSLKKNIKRTNAIFCRDLS
jgi:hypothetical protein